MAVVFSSKNKLQTRDFKELITTSSVVMNVNISIRPVLKESMILKLYINRIGNSINITKIKRRSYLFDESLFAFSTYASLVLRCLCYEYNKTIPYEITIEKQIIRLYL